MRPADPARTFTRVAGAVFVLVVAYTLASKLPEGRMSSDWLHSALHLASAAAAVWAGWISRSPAPSRWFTTAVALIYLPLGLLGWFVDGAFLGTPMAIPLAAADNIFHLLLGTSAVAALALQRRRPAL